MKNPIAIVFQFPKFLGAIGLAVLSSELSSNLVYGGVAGAL